MDRERLIEEVKDHYARLASNESKDHITQSTTDIKPEAYYERLLNAVIDEINAGSFDRFNSGDDIVNAVANNKKLWIPDWQ